MSNIRRLCYDDETGEIITCFVNEETGEPTLDTSVPETATPPIAAESEATGRYMKFPKGFCTRTKEFQSLKENIIAGSNTISYRMLLIPTLMIFPGLICVVLMVLEIYLHVRCHKKNKHLEDPNLYYRSPFHKVTSTFCGVCRECHSASKIGHMQDQRRYRYDYIRGMAL